MPYFELKVGVPPNLALVSPKILVDFSIWNPKTKKAELFLILSSLFDN